MRTILFCFCCYYIISYRFIKSIYCYSNTLRPRQNGRHFADDIFKCICLNDPALVQIMAWRRPWVEVSHLALGIYDTWVNSVNILTHWGRVTHIWVSKLTTIGSDNGSSPGRHQAIILSNAGILLIGPLGIKFNENVIEIYTFSFKKMHLKISSGKWRPFCLGLNVLHDHAEQNANPMHISWNAVYTNSYAYFLGCSVPLRSYFRVCWLCMSRRNFWK